jgi:dTDP-4-dehydrorhamnose 3,5-epimerase/epimerase EvaD
MKMRPLAVAGAFEFSPTIYEDERGLFVSPFQEPAFVEATGHRHTVAQTNHNRSAYGVVRGIHFTLTPPGQAKYVHCARGRALDVVVDLRAGSPTFGRWDAVEMDDLSFRSMYFPVGVGHAFIALAADTVMSYLVTSSYVPEHELSIDPLDADLALPWPAGIEYVLSERDRTAMSFEQAGADGLLPRYADCG